MFDTDMLIGENIRRRRRGRGARPQSERPRTFSSTCRKRRVQQVDAAVNAAEKAFASWSRDDAGRALGAAPEARRRDRARRGGLRRARGAQLRQAAHPRC